MTVTSSPHRSVRSTRGSSHGGEDDCLYDSIPVKVHSTRESRRSTAPEEFGRQSGGVTSGGSSNGLQTIGQSWKPRQEVAGLQDSVCGVASIGLVVTGEMPHTVKETHGLVDQVSFSRACDDIM